MPALTVDSPAQFDECKRIRSALGALGTPQTVGFVLQRVAYAQCFFFSSFFVIWLFVTLLAHTEEDKFSVDEEDKLSSFDVICLPPYVPGHFVFLFQNVSSSLCASKAISMFMLWLCGGVEEGKKNYIRRVPRRSGF